MTTHVFSRMEQAWSEPYRVFFPLGTLFALWGVLLWIFFHMGMLTNYPGTLHAHVMIAGFLFSFAAGFLMTAIPSFTATHAATRKEVLAVIIPLTFLPLTQLLLSNAHVAVVVPLLFSHVGLFVFAGPRFLKRKTLIPESFVFLAVGLISSFAGSLIELAASLGWVPQQWLPLGKSLLLQCSILSIVIGVGSRMVPALLGWAMHPAVQAGLFKSKRWRRLSFWILGFLFPLSYVLEFNGLITLGRVLRLTVTLIIALRYWRLLSLPNYRTKLAFSLWFSAWAIPLGMFGSLVWPQYHIHFLHLIFISGLGLMTLMVATRVVLAHGGYSLLLESSMRSLTTIGAFAGLAALIRLSAGLFPINYFLQLDLAATCWLVMVLVWWKNVGIKTIP